MARGRDDSGAGAGRWAGQFDRVWTTMKSLYYRDGESATAWDRLRDKYRPQAMMAKGHRPESGRCRRRADRRAAVDEAGGRIRRGPSSLRVIPLRRPQGR
jgi:hypothetical protein